MRYKKERKHAMGKAAEKHIENPVRYGFKASDRLIVIGGSVVR